MRRTLAWNILFGLLLGNIYAPLFHVHDHQDDAPLVHAHFPEPEPEPEEAGVHIEPPDSHATARSIDVFVTISGRVIHLDAAVQSSPFTLIEPQPSPGFVRAENPRAHAPPAHRSTAPRAPPV